MTDYYAVTSEMTVQRIIINSTCSNDGPAGKLIAIPATYRSKYIVGYWLATNPERNIIYRNIVAGIELALVGNGDSCRIIIPGIPDKTKLNPVASDSRSG